MTTARPASPAISPEGKGMDHGRGAPHHRQTRGRIGRRHQTLKNRILPQNRYLPGDRKSRTGAFADDRNSRRYRESLNDVTPADACFGKNAAMIESRPTSKRPAVEHFSEKDKPRFVESYGRQHGITLDQCVAIGDSRSDLPLFAEVGRAIALNAADDVRQAAHVSLDTNDLRDVLRHVDGEMVTTRDRA